MLANTHLFSPVIADGRIPRDSIYYDSWYDEMYEYIMNGYSVGGTRITGDHFWYLNFWPIFGLNHKTGRKTIINPRFLEFDYEYFHHIETCRNVGKNMGVFKRRQIGMTEKHAALGGKEFTFFPGSQTVYVAGEDKYTNRLLVNTRRGLNGLHDTEFYKNRDPDRFDYMMAHYSETIELEDGTKQKVDKGLLSEIMGFTAKNNPQVVSSNSPSLIIFEEAGVFPLVRETYAYVKPSMYAEAQKTGMAIFVGTGGKIESGGEAFEYIFYNPDEFDILSFDLSEYDDDVPSDTKKVCYFVPDWVFWKIDKDGNNLKEESIADRDRIVESLEGKDSYHEEKVTMPRKPADMFELPQGGYFGKELASRMNKSRSKILASSELYGKKRVGRLDWIYSGKMIVGVDWAEDPEGDIQIWQMPIRVNSDNRIVKDEEEGTVPWGLYRQGTDSYDKSEANTSVSKGCSIVKKGFFNIEQSSNHMVAKCFMRGENAYTFFENTAKMAWFYGTQNLIEWSNILIFEWYKMMNLDHLLRERPDFVLSRWIKDSKVNNQYGIDPSTKREWLKVTKQNLREPGYVEKIPDIEMLKALIQFRLDPNYNCDQTIAFSLCEVQSLEDNYADEVEANKPQKTTSLMRYRRVNGKIIRRA